MNLCMQHSFFIWTALSNVFRGHYMCRNMVWKIANSLGFLGLGKQESLRKQGLLLIDKTEIVMIDRCTLYGAHFVEDDFSLYLQLLHSVNKLTSVTRNEQGSKIESSLWILIFWWNQGVILLLSRALSSGEIFQQLLWKVLTEWVRNKVKGCLLLFIKQSWTRLVSFIV